MFFMIFVGNGGSKKVRGRAMDEYRDTQRYLLLHSTKH